MKEITPNHKIFLTPDFQKDKYKFFLILQNLKSDSLMLYSDGENYVICRGAVGWPTWIWTKDNFDKNSIEEIKAAMRLYLTENDFDKFTCKKELYDLLVSSEFCELNKEDYFEMGFLSCQKTIKPKNCLGSFGIPSIMDKDILVRYWFDACKEMVGVDDITLEKASEDVDIMLKSNQLFVLRNNENDIVCMANYSIIDGLAKISHVYTPINHRSKGYAANLIFNMTNVLLEKGLVPLLYTDYNYKPSNKAYINVGYEDQGILINFSCSKKRIKQNSI